MSTWVDRHGLSFAEAMRLLPPRASDWPKPGLIRDIGALALYRQSFARCQLCGVALWRWDVRAELHHIVGGSRRSDERCNLIMLCNTACGCHSKVQSSRELLPVVLAAKWRTDREGTDWYRLAVLYGRFLPEPEWPRAYDTIMSANGG